MTDLRSDVRSISRLVGDAFEQISDLLRTEIRLARSEITEKATQAGIGAGLLFSGCLLTIPALVLFLMSLASFLVQRHLSPAAAQLIAGGVGALLSVALIVVGLTRLKPASLVPGTTIEQMKKDAAAVKDMVQ